MRDASCLSISDVHLGNKRNTAKEIINNLDIFFDHYTSKSQFTDLDIIFLAGDLLDSLLDLPDDDSILFVLWLGRLMRFCAKYEIKLRILEGTPSHDWKQSKVSLAVYDLISLELDFKYISTLHIEYMSDLDCHILYIPDEWNASTDVTLQQVKDLMANLRISQVDIGCFHGAFTYQLPPQAHNAPKHNEAAYLALVKHFITIGHIHTHSVYQHILAQGSFDRISHNEEEPKGAVRFNISEKNGNTFSFIENKGAKIFKTITLKSKDLEKSLIQIEKVVAKIPNNSYVRIKATKDHPLYVAFDELKIKFPFYTFTKTNLEDEEENNTIVNNSVTLDQEFTPISINQENIISLIMNEVKAKHNLEPGKLSLLSSILESNNG